MLRAVAVRITAALHPDDLVGRVGGEEFMILPAPFRDTAPADVAERVRSAVERTAIAIGDGEELRCTVSLGCSRAHAGRSTWEDLIAAADAALYAAKNGGRNRVVDHATLSARYHDDAREERVIVSPACY